MYDNLIQDLLEYKAVKATKFIGKNEIIRAVRTRFGNTFSRGNLEITITRGHPNFQERILAKKYKDQVKGMTFFKYLPKKKTAPKKK